MPSTTVFIGALLLSCSNIVTQVLAYKGSVLPMGGALLVNRQTDDCPNYSDCDCEPWGMSCTVSNWDWFECSDFPGSCDNSSSSASPSASKISTKASHSPASTPKHIPSTTSASDKSSTTKDSQKTPSNSSKPHPAATSSAKPSKPQPQLVSYSVWLGYFVYTDGGGYPTTEASWRFWDNKGTDAPDYCNDDEISNTPDADVNAPLYPPSPITFNVPVAGNRECTWTPGGGGPGELNCNHENVATFCEKISNAKESDCGGNPRIAPIAKCIWVEPVS